MSQRRILLGVLVLLGLASGAAGQGPPCRLEDQAFGPDGRVPIRVEEVVTGLEVPWGLAFLPDGGMLLTERPGRIRRVVEGRLRPEPVARSSVEGGEGGLPG